MVSYEQSFKSLIVKPNQSNKPRYCQVEQLGQLLGCVISLRTSVTGITIVALGTSLPDTFASRSAAIHDENADASIGQ